jgi:hypothetical protein
MTINKTNTYTTQNRRVKRRAPLILKRLSKLNIIQTESWLNKKVDFKICKHDAFLEKHSSK